MVSWETCRYGEGREGKGGGLAADLYRRLQFEKDGLVDEDLSRLCTQIFDFVLLKLYGFPRAVASYCT